MNRLSLFATAVVCCASAFAQGGPPPVIEINREMLKEGRSAAHEKVEMDYAKAFRKANLGNHYLALEAVSGAPEVWFVAAYQSFENVEKVLNDTTKPPIKNDLDLLEARDGELRSGTRNLFAVYRPELSYRPDLVSVGKTRYVLIASFRVRLGQDAEFMETAKTYRAAQEKANLNMPSLAYQVIAGSPEGLYVFIEPRESLKSMDEGPARQKALMEAMGAENFRNLMKSGGQMFASIESNMYSVNPRMSYVSKETEDVDPAFWRPKPPAPKPATEAKPKEAKPGQ